MPEAALSRLGLRGGDFWLCLVTTVVAASFLLIRLGHYPLWDDESLVALGAKGILTTGDTVATIDHNIVAYRGGILLEDMRDRGLPPLGSYVTALSFLMFGQEAWSARLPFALVGLVTVGLILRWAVSAGFSGGQLAILSVVLLTNVSFFLFCRQCRYYSLVIALSTALAWLYLTWSCGKWTPLVMGIGSTMLFSAHSLAFVMVNAALWVDYLGWEQRKRRLDYRRLAEFFLPQLAGVATLLSVWNPMRTAFGEYTTTNSAWERLLLLAWNVRDVVQCEFVSLPMVACAIWLAVKARDRHLARGLVAMAVMLVVASAVSPQLVKQTSVADVRYVTPIIPLGIAVGSRAVWLMAQRNLAIAIALLVPTYFCNLGNGGPLLWCSLRSTPEAFVHELMTPIADPYTPTIEWVRKNVRHRESVVVVPDYFTYPLMFHAPDPQYAWQLEKTVGQFADVADVHIRGKTMPDYVICFGPIVMQMSAAMVDWQNRGFNYERVARLDVFWKDLYRPELFWRSFQTVPPRDPEGDCVYVFRRTTTR